jgi:hypothetical protein
MAGFIPIVGGIIGIIGGSLGIGLAGNTIAECIKNGKKVVQIVNNSSIDREVRICSGDDQWNVTIPKDEMYWFSFKSHISTHFWLLDYASGRNIPIFNEGAGNNQLETHELGDNYVIISGDRKEHYLLRKI